mmetsp:Transcript_92891/g.300413  ORF Transcript_92891/g.300413 Transcript_92891/m.300413 type:complete len:203 (+) Transcript_92891:1913-2521(+)
MESTRQWRWPPPRRARLSWSRLCAPQRTTLWPRPPRTSFPRWAAPSGARWLSPVSTRASLTKFPSTLAARAPRAAHLPQRTPSQRPAASGAWQEAVPWPWPFGPPSRGARFEVPPGVAGRARVGEPQARAALNSQRRQAAVYSELAKCGDVGKCLRRVPSPARCLTRSGSGVHLMHLPSAWSQRTPVAPSKQRQCGSIGPAW